MATNNANEVKSEIYHRHKEYSKNNAETAVLRANEECQSQTGKEHETPQLFLNSGCASQPKTYQKLGHTSHITPQQPIPRGHFIHHTNLTALSLAPQVKRQHPPVFFRATYAAQHRIFQKPENTFPLSPRRQAPKNHVICHTNLTALSLAPQVQIQPQSYNISSLVSQPSESYTGQAHEGDMKEPRDKKRTRTTFSELQKNQMKEFADKLGWTLCGKDDDEIHKFCSEIGLTRKHFKIWIHNNKFKLKKTRSTQEPESQVD